MGDFIKKGFIEFKTLAPVYIGCGRTAGKKEYLYDAKTGKVEILQMDMVFEKISRLGLMDSFEKYLLATEKEEQWETGRDLLGFVRNNHIPASEYSTWSREIVSVADPDMNFHSIKDINLFVRNERGMPYIPGSGFKGMLRTILETQYYLENRDQAEEMAYRIREQVQESERRPQRRDRFLKNEDADIDVASMHKELFDSVKNESPSKNLRNQKNDTLRGLLVGDSEELSWDDMCVCQKIDMNTFGDEKPLNVLREAIKPGVIIRIPISIDTRICKYTTADILNAIKIFNTNYLTTFANKFDKAPKTKGNSTTFFLGGGTGYVSKTVTYGILSGREAVDNVSKIINATLNNRARQEHGHHNDVRKGVSPHILKCTRYKGTLMQMGACCVVKYG